MNTEPLDALFAQLPGLVHEILAPARALKRLRADVDVALNNRLRSLLSSDWPPGSVEFVAEETRLRCLCGLVPLADEPVLHFLLGLLRIDGWPGDYCGVDACTSDCPEVSEGTLEEQARGAVLSAEALPDDLAVVWVNRPAVELAVDAIQARGRVCEVRRSPRSGPHGQPRDLLLVHPRSDR